MLNLELVPLVADPITHIYILYVYIYNIYFFQYLLYDLKIPSANFEGVALYSLLSNRNYSYGFN